MEVSAIYAIAAGGIFLALFLIQIRCVLVDWTGSFFVLLSRHLTLPVLVRRHRILGPWTRAGILVHVSYIAVNIALVFLRTESLVDSGRRAGELALINMIFPLSTAHLGFLAGLLGITWRTCHGQQLEEVNEKLRAGNIQLCEEGNHLKLRQDEQVARLHTIDNALDEVRGNFIGVLKVWNDQSAGDSAILPRDGFPKR
ncbi:hypothetical protein N7517_008077 [Penicillium concentricum]|uniref:Uncharacterized protein n=1 Tax=Penicillium concentricum TaxID=293559 RepID=A0A9W9RRS8_9EURO|nr:uncharacterized protein N7517_008077 [Penicillium concentricum]KAJ5365191.1 hypothetical protein N7517_008077 [Penicillium concentricum]